MGKTFSQLTSQQDEDKSILSDNSALASKTANYFSTGSSKPPGSGVLYARAAGTSFVTCPTCQGHGEISHELEKQLVALIPYGDQRLKPRHTKLSVFLAVIICLLTFSVTIFFLYPRPIIVYPVGLNSSMVAFDDSHIQLNMTNILNISNSNFYPITVSQLTAEVLHQTFVVGQVTSSLHLHISPLATGQMHYEVANRISDANTYKICARLKVKVHHILLHIQGTLSCSYLSHQQQLPFRAMNMWTARRTRQCPSWRSSQCPSWRSHTQLDLSAGPVAQAPAACSAPQLQGAHGRTSGFAEGTEMSDFIVPSPDTLSTRSSLSTP